MYYLPEEGKAGDDDNEEDAGGGEQREEWMEFVDLCLVAKDWVEERKAQITEHPVMYDDLVAEKRQHNNIMPTRRAEGRGGQRRATL
jgi:hypothetical protein